MQKIKVFLKRKNINISSKCYFIDALGAMAQGLFASLLIGTIFGTIGTQFGIKLFADIAVFAKNTHVVGASMACAIGFALKCPQLVLFSLITVGAVTNELGGAGGPLAVLIITIISAEIGKAISKETKVDIIVCPFVTILCGSILAFVFAPVIGYFASSIGNLIIWATDLQPFFMGVFISVFVGMALTLPISSAAICAALGLTGLAGGAALAGCCAQMVGFAVMSYKENGFGGLISQGIGTSMLQMPNIIKNPKIWLPPILTSAITGPIATCFFKLQMNGPPISSGMGTCGFVGQIGVYTGWIEPVNDAMKINPTFFDWIGLLVISFILPALLSLFFCNIFRKKGLIKENDLKLKN